MFSQRQGCGSDLTLPCTLWGAPNHMVSSSGPFTLMKLAWHSLAIALASSVLPQPARACAPLAPACHTHAERLEAVSKDTAQAELALCRAALQEPRCELQPAPRHHARARGLLAPRRCPLQTPLEGSRGTCVARGEGGGRTRRAVEENALGGRHAKLLELLWVLHRVLHHLLQPAPSQFASRPGGARVLVAFRVMLMVRPQAHTRGAAPAARA